MKIIFDQYIVTFTEMRTKAKVTDKEYQEFIEIANWSLQIPNLYPYWIGFSCGVVFFAWWLWTNPKPVDLIDDLGVLGLISFIVIYIIAFIFATVSLIYISRIKIEFLNLVKIGAASSIAFFVSKIIAALINWVFVGFVFILIYLGVLFLIKGVYKSDVYLIRSMFSKKK